MPEEVRRAADLLERRWTISILYASYDGATRFNEAICAAVKTLGQFREAEEHNRIALKLAHQREANIWTELAFLYWTWNRLDLMRKHMDEQLNAFQNFTMTRYLNARLLKLEGHFQFPSALRHFPDDFQ